MNSLSPSCFHRSSFNLFAIIQKRPLKLQLRLYLFIHFNLNATNKPIYRTNKANNYTIKIYCLACHQKASSKPKRMP